jgi:hypothetical protein
VTFRKEEMRAILFRGLEHALQRRLCNPRKRCADLGLFRGWDPLGLDGRNAGLADAAQQRLAKILVFDRGGGVVMQTAANLFGMGPAPQHVRGAHAHKFIAGIRHLQRSHLGLCRARESEGSYNRCRTNTEKHYLALSAVFLDNPARAQLAATTIGATPTIGEPLYEKVPVPGRPLSEEPASEEPTNTKAKASMKLMDRI